MTDCIFCRIASGAMAAHLVHEDDQVVAFLDICPIRPGHTQVIPRDHYAYFDDLPEDLAGHMLSVGQRLARSMKRLYGVERVGLVFSGSDIAHAHAHIVPMHEATDITSRRYIVDEEVRFASLPRMEAAVLAGHARKLRDTMAS
jgi:histidine triad (HIT) family protein